MIEVSTSWSILLNKFNLMKKLNLDLMKKLNLDLMKKLNFDLMKFDLLTSTQFKQ